MNRFIDYVVIIFFWKIKGHSYLVHSFAIDSFATLINRFISQVHLQDQRVLIHPQGYSFCLYISQYPEKF